MSRKSWLAFLVVAALTIGAAFGLGMINSDRNDPLPRQTLRPGETIEFQGSRFTLVSFGEVDLPPDVDASQYPAGVAFVRMVLTQEVISAPEDSYEMFCSMRLDSPLGEWDADGSLAYSADWPDKCNQSPDSDVLVPGVTHEVNGAWVVPPDALDGASVMVFFHSTRTAFEVLP